MNGNDTSISDHYNQKEYRGDVIVEIGSLFYEVYFFTEGVLKYEIGANIKDCCRGQPKSSTFAYSYIAKKLGRQQISKVVISLALRYRNDSFFETVVGIEFEKF